MEFGKLPDITHVNFSLPPDPPQNAGLFQKKFLKNSKSTIYVGATGYNMKQWVGKWYPTGTKEKDFLTQYGRQFNTIEHNTTHYRIPDPATVARWREETPADFRFCPKLPQTISHAHDLGVGSRALAEFCENIAGLAEKMGCCFLQLPPYFTVKQLVTLERFLDVWPKNLPLAVEVRHESFFEPTVEAEHFFQTLIFYNISTVITDVAGRRDCCHCRLSKDRVLLRFVGNGLHPTDFQRIEAWAERLNFWIENGLREVYFFTHEPDNLLAPELAVFAGEVFSKKMPAAECRWPQEIRQAVQGSLF